MSLLDLSTDQILTTTRSVRKRLDLSRPVEPEVIRECLEIALQAPSGSNRQPWHFFVVTDADKRMAVADYYRQGAQQYRNHPSTIAAKNKLSATNPERARIQGRVSSSSEYLTEHIHEVPVFLIPCLYGRLDGLPGNQQAGAWGSILPATWSFMLAARARGLGTVWTTFHLIYEKEVAGILGIPYDKVTQAALIPVAYTIGTDFNPAPREPLDTVLHWNNW